MKPSVFLSLEPERDAQEAARCRRAAQRLRREVEISRDKGDPAWAAIQGKAASEFEASAVEHQARADRSFKLRRDWMACNMTAANPGGRAR